MFQRRHNDPDLLFCPLHAFLATTKNNKIVEVVSDGVALITVRCLECARVDKSQLICSAGVFIFVLWNEEREGSAFRPRW